MNSRLVALALAVVTAMSSAAQESAGPPSKHLVCAIDTKNFGAETIRIGDLNLDGAPDLLFVQDIRGPRIITCLTATTIFGEVLWQQGTPSPQNGEVYCDLPVQIYDWDSDGRNDVLYVRQAKYLDVSDDPAAVRERAPRYEGNATLVVLNGQTGAEKSTMPLPAPADDSLVFADLTGRGRREDLVVKDRYWNMWGVAHDGTVLWHWEGSTGHYPAIADVDNDGKDEVFVGYALIDDDGDVLFSSDPQGGHQDAAYIVRASDADWRLFFGNTGLHCLRPDGSVAWEQAMGETQHVTVDRFRADAPMSVVAVDRTPVPHSRDANAWGILYMYDFEGNELWRRQQIPGDWCIATLAVNWTGGGAPKDIFVYGQLPGRPAVIYNGDGEIIETLPMAYSDYRTEQERQAGFYGLVADVWGDSREEVILFGARGACIYANARLCPLPTQYNETLYPGM